MTSEARIETPKASVYMKQLCRHFARKVEASFDDDLKAAWGAPA